jgi:hypothetical protein
MMYICFSEFTNLFIAFMKILTKIVEIQVLAY